MSYRKIQIGDDVSISINADESVTVAGKVFHIPSDTGDCWHIIDSYGRLHYVQQFYVLSQA